MLAETDKMILGQFAQSVVPQLASVAGNSFGSTIDYHFEDDALIIDASAFISVLWTGRKPTKQGAPKGSPTLQQNILQWLRVKGIQPKSKTESSKADPLVSMSWAISKSIHLHGTLLYQQGGKPNPFDAILTQSRIDSLLTLFDESYRKRITSDFIKAIEKT